MKKLWQGSKKIYKTLVEKIGRHKERYGVGSLYDIIFESDNGKVKRIVFITPKFY